MGLVFVEAVALTSFFFVQKSFLFANGGWLHMPDIYPFLLVINAALSP